MFRVPDEIFIVQIIYCISLTGYNTPRTPTTLRNIFYDTKVTMYLCSDIYAHLLNVLKHSNKVETGNFLELLHGPHATGKKH